MNFFRYSYFVQAIRTIVSLTPFGSVQKTVVAT